MVGESVNFAGKFLVSVPVVFSLSHLNMLVSNEHCTDNGQIANKKNEIPMACI